MKQNKKGKIKTGKLALFLLIVAAVLVILGMAIGKGVTYMMGKSGSSGSPISYYLSSAPTRTGAMRPTPCSSPPGTAGIRK